MEVHWEAGSEGSECAAFDSLARATEDASQSAVALRADARIAKLPTGEWQLHLFTERSGSTATRVLNAESCSALADAASVALSLLMVESPPETALPNAEAGAPPPEKEELMRSGMALRALSTEAYPDSRKASGTALRLGTLADTGLEAYGVEGGVLFRWGWLGLDGKLFGTPANYEAAPNNIVRTALLSTAVRACWLWEPLTWARVASCGGLDLGYYRITTEPYQGGSHTEETAPFFAADAGLALSLPLGSRFGARLDVSAIAPLVRTRFMAGNDRLATQTSIYGRLGAGGEVRF